MGNSYLNSKSNGSKSNKKKLDIGSSYFNARSYGTERSVGSVEFIPKPKPKILVIDDSILVRKQIIKILSSEGCEIVGTCIDGRDGVEQYKKLYPNVDLVTMDLTMPRMDGVTALEHILEFDNEAKVLMVSALGKEDHVNRAMQVGAKNYVEKPLESRKVMDRVNSILDLT